jgi:sugar phosphate isomerase/epimerase
MANSECFIPGLVSVTLRALTAEQIVNVAVEAHLRSIEWGGDIHVPHGDLRAAANVRRLCADRGLTISAYGSYFRAGVTEPSNPPFAQVLQTAQALGASRIRLWAGNNGSAVASADTQRRVVDDLLSACAAAAKDAIVIGLEFHDRTLTDTPDSAMLLCNEVAADNLRCNWQPRVGQPSSVALADAEALRTRLGDVHVFHLAADRSRLPLAQGAETWRSYLASIARRDGVRRHASLEFVRNDDPKQVLADARVLHEILARLDEVIDVA